MVRSLDRKTVTEHYHELALPAYESMITGGGEQIAKAACVIIMGLVSQDVRTLTAVTGFPRSEIDIFVSNARKAEIFLGHLEVCSGAVDDSFDDLNRFMALLMDAMVVAGDIRRVWIDDDWVYERFE